jgi:hypothetical protein
MYDDSMLAEAGIATSLAWPLALQPRPLDGNDTLGIRITIADSYLCMFMIAHHSP